MLEETAETQNVIIVSGASRGIGAATALLAAKKGYAVCVNYRSTGDEAKQIVKKITGAGGNAISVSADVSNEKDVAHLVDKTLTRYGKIDALVNNAGVAGPRAELTEITMETLNEVIGTNVIGPFLCCREVLPHMYQRGSGSIVNVSSQAAITGGHNLSHYAATKGAINSMTLGLAREAARHGVRVNAVSPGIVSTAMNDAEDQNSLAFQRPSAPNEIAEVIMWLLSSKASCANGTILPVHSI